MKKEQNSQDINKGDELVSLPPHSKDLEAAILGALMLERDAIYIISDLLVPDDFYTEANQLVYKAILNIFSRGSTCDITLVTEELHRMQVLDQIGGPFYVTTLTNTVVSSANIEAHARIVYQHSMRRQLIRMGRVISKEAYQRDNDVFDLVDKYHKTLDTINPDSRIQKNIHAPYIVKQSLELIEKAANAGEIPGVPTGNRMLDEKFGGYMETDLSLLAARPSHGKTAVAVAQIEHQTSIINPNYDPKEPASYSLYPAFCASVEMASKLLMLRMFSAKLFKQNHRIPYSQMRKGRVTPDQMTLINLAAAELAKQNLYIDDASNVTTTSFRARLLRLVREFGVKIAYIDYVQIIKRLAGPKINYQNDAAFLKDVMYELKGLAKEANIPIIALAQILRETEKREGVGAFRFRMSDLKGSGGLEEASDNILIIYRPEAVDPNPIDPITGASLKDILQMELVKTRNDSPGVINVPFHMAYNSFGNDSVVETIQAYLSAHPAAHGGLF